VREFSVDDGLYAVTLNRVSGRLSVADAHLPASGVTYYLEPNEALNLASALLQYATKKGVDE